jgi:hypothetical protein
MRRHIGSLLGGLVGFAVAYLGVGSLLSETRDATAPLRADSSSPTRAPVHESATLVAPGTSAEPSNASTVTPTAADEPAAATATIDRAADDREMRGFLLHGVVTARGGAPLGGAYVGVQLPFGGRAASTTDEIGRYTLGPLESRTWSVSAGMTDHHSASIDVAPPDDGTLIRRDFELAPQQIVRVRIVTSEGTPAVGSALLYWYRFRLVPVVTRDDPGTTFTDVRGSLGNPFGIGWFRNAGLMGYPAATPDEYGAVVLREDGPAWVSLVAAHQVIAKQALVPDMDEVTFVVDPSDLTALHATVRGRALDAESGGALAGQAWLNDTSYTSGPEVRVAADPANGEFAIEGALPGERWLIVSCEGYADVKRKVDVPRGATFEAGDVMLHRPVALSGKVRDSAGKPYEALVEWGELDTASGAIEWVPQVRAECKRDGTFTVRGLEPAVYVVRATGREPSGTRASETRFVSRPLRADARVGSVEGLDFLIEPTTVVWLVAKVRARDPGGVWTYAAVLGSDGLPVARGWPGRYMDETPLYVPRGKWTLVLTHGGTELERRAFVVGDTPLRIELDS